LGPLIFLTPWTIEMTNTVGGSVTGTAIFLCRFAEQDQAMEQQLLEKRQLREALQVSTQRSHEIRRSDFIRLLGYCILGTFGVSQRVAKHGFISFPSFEC